MGILAGIKVQHQLLPTLLWITDGYLDACNRKVIGGNLLAILDQDAKSTMLDLAYIGKGETYTCIHDICPAGQIRLRL